MQILFHQAMSLSLGLVLCSGKDAKSLPDFRGTDDNLISITLNGLVLDRKMLTLINKIGNERLKLWRPTIFLY
jgi:hypothetical protein